MRCRGFGDSGKTGRAYIVNEAHGLRKDTIRQLLVVLERLPAHVVVVFTTTCDGQESLFDDYDDAHPLLSRCTRLELSRRDLAKAFAERAQTIARVEGLDGKPLANYVKLAQKHRNNMRAILDAFQNPQELPKALAPVFIRRKDNVPCRAWSWSNQRITALFGHSDARGYRHGQVIALGVQNLSTWCHEMVHAADDRLGKLIARKVNLVSLKDGVDLSTAAGRLIANVLASVAAYENEVRSERIVAGQAAARASGILLAAKQVRFGRGHTSPKRKRGGGLRSSLALRVSVNPGRERYKRWGGSKKGRRITVKPEQIRTIERRRKEETPIAAIARATGLSRPTVYSVLAESNGR